MPQKPRGSAAQGWVDPQVSLSPPLSDFLVGRRAVAEWPYRGAGGGYVPGDVGDWSPLQVSSGSPSRCVLTSLSLPHQGAHCAFEERRGLHCVKTLGAVSGQKN